MFMWLCIATGFTGGLTLVFLLRLAHRNLADVPSVSAYFSPKGGSAEAVVQCLVKARKEVLVLARSFACPPIAKAVLDAKLRGVRVDIVLDRQNEKDPTSDLHLFAEQGLAPTLDTHFTCCHDNLILIDGRTLILGSFDFTRQADEENSDSLLVVSGFPAVMQACRKHFQDARAHAREVSRPATPAPKPATDKAEPEKPETIADKPAKRAA